MTRLFSKPSLNYIVKECYSMGRLFITLAISFVLALILAWVLISYFSLDLWEVASFAAVVMAMLVTVAFPYWDQTKACEQCHPGYDEGWWW